jgi:hypothetical protein
MRSLLSGVVLCLAAVASALGQTSVVSVFQTKAQTAISSGKAFTGLTVAVNAAAIAGKQVLGSMLLGPGWLYTATAIGWDSIQVGKAYSACTQ